MVGIIVTGHGNFATGISSSLKLIAGTPESYETVDFVETDGVIELENKLENAISNLNDCNGIIIFTDLIGGSPFKSSVEISLKHENIAVMSGTNLGMLIETVMSRNFMDDVNSLCNVAINTGKDQVIRFELKEKVEVEEEDGI